MGIGIQMLQKYFRDGTESCRNSTGIELVHVETLQVAWEILPMMKSRCRHG